MLHWAGEWLKGPQASHSASQIRTQPQLRQQKPGMCAWCCKLLMLGAACWCALLPSRASKLHLTIHSQGCIIMHIFPAQWAQQTSIPSNRLPAAAAVLVKQQLFPVKQAVVLLLAAAGQALTAAAQRAPAPAPSSLGAYVDSAGRINSCYAIDGIASPAFAANVSYTDSGSVGSCTVYFKVSHPSFGIFWPCLSHCACPWSTVWTPNSLFYLFKHNLCGFHLGM